MPRNALRRISCPTTRYGIRNITGSVHPGSSTTMIPSEIRYSGTKNTAATRIRISRFFSFLFILSPP